MNASDIAPERLRNLLDLYAMNDSLAGNAAEPGPWTMNLLNPHGVGVDTEWKEAKAGDAFQATQWGRATAPVDVDTETNPKPDPKGNGVPLQVEVGIVLSLGLNFRVAMLAPDWRRFMVDFKDGMFSRIMEVKGDESAAMAQTSLEHAQPAEWWRGTDEASFRRDLERFRIVKALEAEAKGEVPRAKLLRLTTGPGNPYLLNVANIVDVWALEDDGDNDDAQSSITLNCSEVDTVGVRETVAQIEAMIRNAGHVVIGPESIAYTDGPGRSVSNVQATDETGREVLPGHDPASDVLATG